MSGYNILTDQELMVLLKEGDNLAFSEIYNRYWKVLLNSAYQRLRSTQASEEIVQDIFVSFFVRRKEIELKSSLEAYLKSALKYRVFNLFRSRKIQLDVVALTDTNETSSIDASPLPDELVELTELRNKIYDISTRMSEQQRRVFLMSRFEQLTQKEIADQLGISISTVQKHITKATEVLRAEFNTHSIDFIAICFFIYLGG